MTLSQFSQRFSSQLVYGDPIATEHDTTILPVSRVGPAGSSAIGVYVISNGDAKWLPAVDANRIAQIGVATGFVAAALSCLAVLRQPPWPTTTIRVTKKI